MFLNYNFNLQKIKPNRKRWAKPTQIKEEETKFKKNLCLSMEYAGKKRIVRRVLKILLSGLSVKYVVSHTE